MVKKEFFMTRSDGVKLFRSYSDENWKILNKINGEIYDEAIDLEGSKNEYVETDIQIGSDIELSETEVALDI